MHGQNHIKKHIIIIIISSSSSSSSSNSSSIHYSVTNFLSTRHILIITVFCNTIYIAGQRLSRLEFSCNLFGQ